MEHLSAREHSTGESASPFYAWHPIIHTEPDKTGLDARGKTSTSSLAEWWDNKICVHKFEMYKAFHIIGTPLIIVKYVVIHSFNMS